MRIKVIIADDNSFVREGLKIILSTFPEIEVSATVEDGRQAVDYCEEHHIDVALLDVQMPNMSGLEAARQLAERTDTKPLILTTFDHEEFIRDAVQSGAKGYLLKNNDPERIRDAIKSVYHGHSVLQDTVLDKLVTSLGEGGQKAEDTATIDRTIFTERELEIMALIAKGMSNRDIAGQLYISQGTTANYITSILSKTGLEHRTQIAIYYLTGEGMTRD